LAARRNKVFLFSEGEFIMNNRDTIVVVFRVVAIFLFFNLLANVPRTINDLAFVSVLDPVPSSSLFRVIRFIVMLSIPFVFAFLLWNKSSWIADKILAPLGMDELWEDQITDEIPQEERIDVLQPEAIHETTVTHLHRDEIESIVLTAIGVWVLASSVPELLRFLFTVFSHNLLMNDVISAGIIPLVKALIGGWLLLRSNHLILWLRRWREYRMQD
jgi:hypothetical protein